MPVEVKICGLDRRETMQAAIDAGADYAGLMFFPPSPRHLDFDEGAKLAAQARGRTRIVAVTVNPDDHLIEEIASRIQPDFIQLHGEETAARIKAIKKRWGLAVIKAVKVSAKEDFACVKELEAHADLILFDAKAPAGLTNALPGGNGLQFDWRLLAQLPPAASHMLSGGLDAANVAAAISLTGVVAVDVSSGVESAPGIKDAAAIREFINAAKAAKTNKVAQ